MTRANPLPQTIKHREVISTDVKQIYEIFKKHALSLPPIKGKGGIYEVIIKKHLPRLSS